MKHMKHDRKRLTTERWGEGGGPSVIGCETADRDAVPAVVEMVSTIVSTTHSSHNHPGIRRKQDAQGCGCSKMPETGISSTPSAYVHAQKQEKEEISPVVACLPWTLDARTSASAAQAGKPP